MDDDRQRQQDDPDKAPSLGHTIVWGIVTVVCVALVTWLCAGWRR